MNDWISLRFSIAIFISAFLLFQVQPVVSKHILPWFGGTPSVWTTCLVFFQTLLFLGYAFAHFSVSHLRHRNMLVLYLVLLLAAALVPVLPASTWRPEGTEEPTLRIVLMLLVSTGPTFFVLAAASPILQSWFARRHPGRSPYALYAVSNAGSLLALLSYPVLIEPNSTLNTQAQIWRLLFVVFVVVCALLAWHVRSAGRLAAPDPSQPAAAPDLPLGHSLLVLLWASCGVMLFMAVTNQLTLNVAAVPFLWVMPLTLYLGSFILAFSGERRYSRKLFAPLMLAAFLVFYVFLPGEFGGADILENLGLTPKIVLAATCLFVLCMVCHGELFRLRPPAAHLTRYYMTISFGGATGGFFVAILAPRIFDLFFELQIALVLCGALFLLSLYRDPRSPLAWGRRKPVWAAMTLLFAGMLGVSIYLSRSQLQDSVYTERNFFGILRVVADSGTEGLDDSHRVFLHGSTLHGMQFDAEQLKREPTLYYGPITGISAVMSNFKRNQPRKIGVVGMGVATLAAFGTEKDSFVYYEIDPDVEHVASELFSYVEDSPATSQVILGDGRIQLERQEPQDFDILVLDAFSSDAVPVHLLTLEAMQVYAGHLKADGILVFNVSNRFLDLAPIIYHLADSQRMRAVAIANQFRPGGVSIAAKWMFLSHNEVFLRSLMQLYAQPEHSEWTEVSIGDHNEYDKIRPWTDSYSNLFQIID